jgi:discoidin domain receptor family protein 2
VSEAANEFLEIDLGSEHYVGGVITQGRFANGLGQEFAEFFLLQYWRPGMEDFKDYVNGAGVDLFTGNRDTYSEVETRLEPALIASRVRIVPFSYHPRTVCMRVELKGCKTLIAGKSLKSC